MSEGWKSMSEAGHVPPPKPPAPTGPTAKKSDRTALYVILCVVGVIFLGCGGLFGVGAWVGATAPDAVPEDRAGVINAFDVYAWVGQGTEPAAAWEQLDVGPAFLGSRDWDYEYEAPESDDQMTFVSSSRTDEGTTSSARSTFSTLKFAAGLGAGMMADDVEVTDVSELLTWGDQRYLGRMDGPNGPFGHIVVVRRDTTVLFAVFGAVYFEDEAAVDEFLVPVLERAASYEMAGAVDQGPVPE